MWMMPSCILSLLVVAEWLLSLCALCSGCLLMYEVYLLHCEANQNKTPKPSQNYAAGSTAKRGTHELPSERLQQLQNDNFRLYRKRRNL